MGFGVALGCISAGVDVAARLGRTAAAEGCAARVSATAVATGAFSVGTGAAVWPGKLQAAAANAKTAVPRVSFQWFFVISYLLKIPSGVGGVHPNVWLL